MKGCSQCGTVSPSKSYWKRHYFCFSCYSAREAIAEKARRKVLQAVYRHELKPARLLKCTDCGRDAKFYDHRDYSKPLEVEPVCGSCNQLRGPGKIDLEAA